VFENARKSRKKIGLCMIAPLDRRS